MRFRRIALLGASFVLSAGAAAQMPPVPPALVTDPPGDADFPARMEVLHIASGGVEINGVAYLASGPGPHPALVICHGWPGNEKNLDLAQAVRRAGWHAITFNYRGSWGSPGTFRFAHTVEDARAVLAFLRDPARAIALRLDPEQIAISGHSMGGWVAAMVSGRDARVLGTALISAANMGALGAMPRAQLIELAESNAETLASTSPEAMADELIVSREAFDFRAIAAGLANHPLLVLSSDDGLKPQTDALVTAVDAAGGTDVTAAHVPTDHIWSDRRIELQARIIQWLRALERPHP